MRLRMQVTALILPISHSMHSVSIYHNVDFSLPFLDEEGASQSQAFIRVMSFKSRPQRGHQTVASCSLLSPNLYDLKGTKGEKDSTVYSGHFGFINVYSVT